MFSSGSFYCQSKLKIHFNCIFLFIFMTDIHSASLSRLSPSLRLLSVPEELLGGSSTSGVPTCYWQPRTHGLGRGLNPHFSTTTFFVFFSQDIPSPRSVLFFQEAENQASNPRGFAPLPGVQYCSIVIFSIVSFHILGHDLLAGTPAATDLSHPLSKNTRGHLAHL